MRWLLHWIVNALVLLLVSHFVSGFHISGFASALFAVVIIGIVNATLGLFLKVMTFPLSFLTLGLFVFVIDAIVALALKQAGSRILRDGIQARLDRGADSGADPDAPRLRYIGQEAKLTGM